MTLIHNPLSWIQNSEPVSGGTGGNSDGVVNRPLIQLLENDKNLDERLTALGSTTELKTILNNAITNSEIAGDANIHETKVNMLFRGMQRPSGGTYSTTAEIAEDLNAFASVLRSATTEQAVDFYADFRRSNLAGSGFEEMGKHPSGVSLINEGMYIPTRVDQTTKGYMCFGHNSIAALGSSNTMYPTLNANGFQIQINDGRLKNNAYYVVDNFPPAPNRSTLPNRADLYFFEVWTEDISTKDFVYPYGNTQFKADFYKGIELVFGSFVGFGTYSLLGNWQTEGDLVGKGSVWSTLSNTDKKKYIDNRANNMYLTEEGKVVQIRYRLRAVLGLGSNWEKIGFQDKLGYNSSAFVTPKGMKTAIGADVSTGVEGFYDSFLNFNLSDVYPTLGCWTATDTSESLNTDTSFDGNCFAVPVCLVTRRNSGAYHPVLNPMGSAMCLNNDNTTEAFWYNTNRVYTTVEDCFNYSKGGHIASIVVGRDCDGLYYDNLHERDILDLRYQAKKVVDYNATLDREFIKFMAGNIRGWKPLKKMNPQIEVSVDSATMETAFGKPAAKITLQGEKAGITISDLSGVAFIQGKSKRWYSVVKKSIVGNDTIMYLDPRYNDVTAEFISVDSVTGNPTGVPYFTTMFEVLNSDISTNTIQFVDVIGNPINYPNFIKLNGLYGYPLLSGESRQDYLPSNDSLNMSSVSGHTVKIFKLARRIKDPSKVRIVMRAADGSWYSHSSNFAVLDTTNLQSLVDNTEIVDRECSFSPSLNTVALNFTEFYPNLAYSTLQDMEDNVVIMFTYEVVANPTVETELLPLLAYSNVFISNLKGSNCTAQLINKVSSETSGDFLGEATLWTFRRKLDNTLSSSDTIKHLAVDIEDIQTPMVKVWPMLVKKDGVLRVSMLYKEVSTPSNDDGEITVTNNEKLEGTSNYVLCGNKSFNTQILFKE